MKYPILFSAISIAIYVVVTFLVLRSVSRQPLVSGHQKSSPIQFLLPAFFAACFHGISLVNSIWIDSGINFSFLGMLSLVILIIVVILLTTAINKPVEKLGVVIFPLAALVQIFTCIFPLKIHLLGEIGPGMEIHILASILAYSLLNIAAFQAILLAVQDRQLHRRGSNRFIRSFPPLQTMEILLFQMIIAGFLMLTISLGSGIVFIDDLFAQHLAHKTLLSILAWIFFGVLLWGRTVYGWRGQTAIRWTLVGFVSLMLAYFGSKMVLEIILHRG